MMNSGTITPARKLQKPVTSIFRLIIVPLVLVMVALATAVTWLTYANGRDAVDRLVYARMNDATQRAEQFIESLVRESHLVTQILAQSVISGELDPSDHAGLEPVLFRLTSLSARAPYIYAADPNGGFIGINRSNFNQIMLLQQIAGDPLRHIWLIQTPGDRSKPQPKLTQPYDSRTRPWYWLAAISDTPVWTPVYSSIRTGASILTLAVPARRIGGDLRGVIAMNLPIQNLESLLMRLDLTPGARLFLLERDGGFVAGTGDGKEIRPRLGDATQPGPEARRFTSELADTMARESARHLLAAGDRLNSGHTAVVAIDGREVFVSGKRLSRADAPDWIIGVAIPRSAFMRDVMAALARGVGLAILALVVAVGLGIFTVRRVTRDIRALRLAAESVSKGEWETRLPLERKDELGVLAHSFDTMRAEVRSSLQTIQDQNVKLEQLNLELEDKVSQRTAELRRQATELAHKNEQLEDAVRLREEVDRIARHDLRTPINSIVAVPRLLREGRALSREEEELLGVVEQSGYRILNMVNLSLDLYRMEQGTYRFRPQAVNLVELVDRVAQDVRNHAAAKNVEIRIRANGKPAATGERVFAWAEELLCYSILANLLKNALEAAPDGEAITVSIDSEQMVMVRIHNAGAVPQAIRDSFFEKYATAGKAGGSGLGTYSARIMARVQDGELEMHTSDEHGTTLTLRLHKLPSGVAPPAPRTTTATTASSTGADLPALRVLVADDDEYNLLVMRRYLPSPPITLETVVNGRAAVDAATANPPDVIFVDIDMPVMGGLEAAANIRAKQKSAARPPCAIIAFSSYDEDRGRMRALAAGCDYYLSKPVSRETIHGVLRSWAESARFPETVAAPSTAAANSQNDAAEDVVTIDPDLKSALPGFMESRMAAIDEMAQALESGDREAVRRLSHRLAGSFGLYGFKWAAHATRHIEHEAPSAAPDELRTGIAALRNYLLGVRIRFGEEVEQPPTEKPKPATL
jgi:signal transduction histidine kinase/CheY-like chemotaxis protein